MIPSIRVRLALAFLVTLAILTSVVILAYRSTDRLAHAGFAFPAARERMMALDEAMVSVQGAETAQRGFLLTGDSVFLEPLERARQELPDHRARIRSLGDSPDIRRIDSLLQHRMVDLESTLTLQATAGPAAARDRMLQGRGRQIMDSLRVASLRVRAARDSAARAAQAAAGDRSWDALLAITALSFSGLAILGALGIALLRNAREQKQVEASLVAEQERLEQRVRERTAEVETERVRAASEAKRAQDAADQYRMLVEQVRDYAIFRIDREGRPESWNEGVARVFGYSEAEFIGSDLELIFTEADRTAGVPGRELAQAAASGVASNDRWMRRRDGTHFFAAGVTTALHDGAGNLLGFTKVLRDQSVWKETEEALRRSEARYRLVARASREAIWDWNLIADTIEWNEGVEHLFGYRLEDVPPDTSWWFEHVHPDDRARVVAGLRAVIESSAEFWSDEYRFQRADGGYATVTDRGMVARDQDGRGYRMLGTMADFTERRRSDEKLAQAQRIEAVGRLAGGVAHDLNNMLTTIVGYSMFLEQSLDESDEERRADVAEIRKAADRSAALTRSLLAFARRELIRPQSLDLNEVVRDLERVLRTALGESVALELRLDAESPIVFADRGRLEQVVLNLALNARDAMPAGGRLTITTGNVDLGPDAAARHPGTEIIPGPFARMVVSDTGHGMDAGTMARIFEPFFTTKGVGEGTGLGLATVYGTVKQAGGFVWAYSEPGHGSSFTVYLPQSGVAEDVIETPVPIARIPRGGTETILVVEDEDTVRLLAWRTLGAAGYDCLQAVDASAAISMLRRIDRPIDLLLTDIVMPGMGGDELARALSETNPDMRTLFTSGFTDDEVVRRGLMQPGAPFLQKPWAPEQLLQRVREVLDSEQPARESMA